MDYKKLFDLSSNHVVICGSNGLIGKELVKCFKDLGAKVTGLDINNQNLADADDFFQFDMNSLSSVKDSTEHLIQKNGKIDSWINVAYPRTKDWSKKLEEADLSWFNENTNLHLGGYFQTSKIVLELMKKQGSGSLINYSSIYGIVGPNFNLYKDLPMTNPVAYSAIKAGIINLSRYFATYYGPSGVRINSISPGGVLDNQNSIFVDRYNELTPLRRMALPEEIAAATVFLATPASNYVTGHNLVVDGGWSIQ